MHLVVIEKQLGKMLGEKIACLTQHFNQSYIKSHVYPLLRCNAWEG